jgi:hypothetical protein
VGSESSVIKESLWFSVPLSLLGNNSMKTFSRNKVLLETFSIVRYQRKVCDNFFADIPLILLNK